MHITTSTIFSVRSQETECVWSSVLRPVEAREKHGLTCSRRQLSPLLKGGMAGAEGPDHKLVSAWIGEAESLA